MSQFSLSKAIAKVASFNPRAEKHGEKNVAAGDIKFEVKAHSSVLDSFDPSYRPFLFRKADSAGDQPDMLGDTLTALAKPNLKPLSLDEEFPGYTLRIGAGLEASKVQVLTEVKLSGFKFEAQQGGSVAMSFSAAVHPDSEQAGALCALIQEQVELTLEPPVATAQQGDLADDVGEGEGDEQARRRSHPRNAAMH